MKKIKYDNPIGLQVELTGRCNLKCHHCYNSSGDFGRFDVTDDSWIEFFEELNKKYSLPTVNITGGEPLLRRKLLFKILEIFSEYNPSTRVRIMTNGYYLNQSFLDVLSQYNNPIDFQISLDGADKSEHQAVRIVKYSWEKAIDACLMVVNSGYRLQIASTITSANYEKIERLFKLALLVGADSLGIGSALPLGRGIQDKKGLILSADTRNEVANRLKNLKRDYTPFLDINLTSSLSEVYQKYSELEQDWLIIDHRGNVKIDTRLPYVVGNIQSLSIENLWRLVQQKYVDPMIMTEISKALSDNTIISNVERIMI
ncbi:radical SAM protein [Streptococcus dysgalactiae]|uniref:radical SAM protein n=1 Tax=Streptococcus dysgalactiae TaxID=1334 RepID=UPI0022B6D177|nr:radical SAM protein [Streptococcus dysgalactiae]